MKILIELGDNFQKGHCLECPFATFHNLDFNPQCIFGYTWGKCDLKIAEDNVIKMGGGS